MPEAKLSFPGRWFQLWAFKVGHQQLLFRSPKDENASTRIDVLFKAVTAMCLPAWLEGLEIEKAEVASVPEIAQVTNPGLLLDRHAYRVTGTDGTSGFVVCAWVGVHEDEAEHHDPSVLLDRPI